VYDPTSPLLQRVKSRISEKSWQRRIERARADEAIVKQILSKESRGTSLNSAIASVVPKSRRSWAMRRIPAYRQRGFEALIDGRTPRDQTVSRACRQALQEARTANPRICATDALVVLHAQGITPLPSESTIKREFSRVDDRRKYAARKSRSETDDIEVVDLPFAGGELLLAAETETGGIAALTSAVSEIAEAAHAAADGQVPEKDTARRDDLGQFTAAYNRARRRKAGEEIAGYLRPADEKAEGRVPTWPRFVHERDKTIDAKMRMLTFGWLVAKTKGWNALRATDAAGLEPLTGFAYMPSTLAKFVSALAISSAGDPLLHAVARRWHHVAQEHFDEPGAMAAIYVDNHVKEVWSSLFTQSGKVSHRNRVMPSITTTYAHTGAGTPMVLSVQSGSAPLAPRLITLVEEAERLLGGDVERAVVIDAEGSTFDLLESFSKKGRVLITPLRPSRAPELELRYSRGSYYRPYRDNDELRVATCTLRHKSSGRSLDLRALLIRREHRISDTVLLTTGTAPEMEGRDLADIYFHRWPVQENFFKDGVAAVALDEHRGNCGRMVANVAVVTELDRLASRERKHRNALEEIRAASATLSGSAVQASREERSARASLTARRGRLDAMVKRRETSGAAFARTAAEHHQALARAEKVEAVAKKARLAVERSEARAAKLEERLAKASARKKHIEAQRTIRQLDVAQDKILTATKLTATQLIAFVLRVYFMALPMTPETFASRVFSMRGRKEIGRNAEHVIFFENARDPEINAALRNACERLNERGLTREGRRLTYAVEEPPPSTAWFD
jgi:hypothetical protein